MMNVTISYIPGIRTHFLPAADIPKYVAEGNVDLGITGKKISNFSVETDLKLECRQSDLKCVCVETV